MKQLHLIRASEADLRQLSQAIQEHDLPDVYRKRLAGQAESNHARAVLLKQHLLADYIPIHSRTPAGRVLLKFGAMHMGRGFDPLHQLNLGNTVQKWRMSKACNRADSGFTYSIEFFPIY